MKRDNHRKIATRFAVTVIAVIGSGYLWAHPGAAGHVTANPPAHGMMHALMSAPALIGATCVALGGLWLAAQLYKRGRRTIMPGRGPELNRE